MLTVRGLSRNKTVSANFNLLFEGQGGHNTGQENDIVGRKGTKHGHSGQKGQESHIFAVVLFPGRAR